MRKLLVLGVMGIAIALASCNKDETKLADRDTANYGVKVFEFTPAPGQFVNWYYTANTPKQACDYAQGRLSRKEYVSLGGFGGYIVVGFGRRVVNVEGEYDFAILGNSIFTGSSEPGVVWVMADEDGDGLPNDTWYELKGSEYGKPETIQDYVVTYFKPLEDKSDVRWEDNKGGSGTIDYLPAHHTQATYYPLWIDSDNYLLTGTLLKARNVPVEGSDDWHNGDYDWGYADNFGSDMLVGTHENRFKIENAVRSDGTPANLTHIDFVKVQCGVNAKSGQAASASIGELSTEVCSIRAINR